MAGTRRSTARRHSELLHASAALAELFLADAVMEDMYLYAPDLQRGTISPSPTTTACAVLDLSDIIYKSDGR